MWGAGGEPNRRRCRRDPGGAAVLARAAPVSITRAVPALAGLWDKSAVWRAVATGLGVLGLALLVAALVAREPPDFSDRPVIAVVRDYGQHPLWTIRLARGAHQIAADSLHPPPVPPGHVFQLWLRAPGAAAPRPLGLLPQFGRKTIAVTPANSRLLAGPGELMVTLEPSGGSPRPGPSGAVLFRGSLDGPG
jgi:anti-sigma-K factor RskA